MVIVIQNEEESAQHPPIVLADNRKNLDEVVVGKMSRKRGDCVDKVECSWPGLGGGRRRHQQAWPGLVPANLVGGAAVVLQVLFAELTHDGCPDPCVEGDLVVQGNTFETGRPLDRVRMTEER